MQSIKGLTYVCVPAHDERERRKPNFTESETLFLVEQFEKYKSILTSKVINSSTNKKKQRVWQLISNEINLRNPGVKRLPIDIKRKWKNMIRVANHDPNLVPLSITKDSKPDGQAVAHETTRAAINKRIFQIRHNGTVEINNTPDPRQLNSIPEQQITEVPDEELTKAENLLEEAESDFYGKKKDESLSVPLRRNSENGNVLEEQPPRRDSVLEALVPAREHEQSSLMGKGSDNEGEIDILVDNQQLGMPCDRVDSTENVQRPVVMISHTDDTGYPKVSSVISQALPPGINQRRRPMQTNSNHHSTYVNNRRPYSHKSPQGMGRFSRQPGPSRFNLLQRKHPWDVQDDFTRVNRELLEAERAKIDMEKEKIALEQEKIKLENIKLGLEIELLRKQLYGEGYEDLQDDIDM